MNNQSKKDERRGSALILAIVLLAVLGIGVTALYQHLHRSFEDHRRFEREQTAAYLAEAGVHKALAALRATPAEYTGEKDLRLGSGTVAIAVEPGASPGAYKIRSQATLGDGVVTRAAYTLNAEARLNSSGAWTVTHWRREKKQS